MNFFWRKYFFLAAIKPETAKQQQMFYNNNNYTHITLPYNIKMHKLLLFFRSLSHSRTHTDNNNRSALSGSYLGLFFDMYTRHFEILRHMVLYVERIFSLMSCLRRRRRRRSREEKEKRFRLLFLLLVLPLPLFFTCTRSSLLMCISSNFLCCFFPLSHFAVDRVWHFIFTLFSCTLQSSKDDRL